MSEMVILTDDGEIIPLSGVSMKEVTKDGAKLKEDTGEGRHQANELREKDGEKKA